jgi:hypothetical protein
LVIHNGFINFIAIVQNVKPTQACSTPAGRQVISTTLTADRLLKQKLIGTSNIISQLVLAFSTRNMFFQSQIRVAPKKFHNQT